MLFRFQCSEFSPGETLDSVSGGGCLSPFSSYLNITSRLEVMSILRVMIYRVRQLEVYCLIVELKYACESSSQGNANQKGAVSK